MRKLLPLALALLILFSGCADTTTPPSTSQPSPAATQAKTQTVYITNSGAKYHSDGCRYLAKSKKPISLSEALNKGYEPCSKCSPPE